MGNCQQCAKVGPMIEDCCLSLINNKSKADIPIEFWQQLFFFFRHIKEFDIHFLIDTQTPGLSTEGRMGRGPPPPSPEVPPMQNNLVVLHFSVIQKEPPVEIWTYNLEHTNKVTHWVPPKKHQHNRFSIIICLSKYSFASPGRMLTSSSEIMTKTWMVLCLGESLLGRSLRTKELSNLWMQTMMGRFQNQ